jgi:hypothetical protein
MSQNHIYTEGSLFKRKAITDKSKKAGLRSALLYPAFFDLKIG